MSYRNRERRKLRRKARWLQKLMLAEFYRGDAMLRRLRCLGKAGVTAADFDCPGGTLIQESFIHHADLR